MSDAAEVPQPEPGQAPAGETDASALTISDADVASAIEGALLAEQETPVRTVSEFGRGLQRRLEDQAEGPVKELLRADAYVCQLRADHGNNAATWGTAFVPDVILRGRAPFPPPVGGYSDVVRPYLAQRAETSTRPALRARYLDFAWQRWRDGEAGKRAIDQYLAAAAEADMADIELVSDADDGLQRVLDLTQRLKPDLEPIRGQVLAELRRRLDADRTGSILEIIERGAGLLATGKDSASQFAEDLMEAGGKRTTATLGADQLLGAADRLFRACGAPDRGNAARARLAVLHEGDAGQAQGLLRQHHLREALRLYRDAGDSTAVDRLRPEFERAGHEAVAELRSIETEQSFTRDEIAEAVSRLRIGRQPALAALLTLPWELGMWPDWAEVRRKREKRETGSFVALFGHTLMMPDGRFQPEPDPDRFPEAHARSRDFHHFAQDAGLLAGLVLSLYLPELRRRGNWSAPLFVAALAALDDDLAARAEAGIGLFEADKHWAALHALVPCLETAVRLLAAEVGARRSSYTPHEGFRWASLETMLAEPEMVAAMGEDFITELKALFLDGYGLNIRNNVAHGAAAMNSAPTDAMIVVLAILSVCRFVAVQRLPAPATPDEGPPTPTTP